MVGNGGVCQVFSESFEFIFDGAVKMRYDQFLNMGFNLPKFFGVFCTVAACAMVSPAMAQSTVPASGQSILLSSPSGNGFQLPATKSVSHSAGLNLGNAIQAPHNPFGDEDIAPPDSLTPLPAPPVNSLQKMMAEHKKNWAEMTPSEILGVKTDEKDDGLLPDTTDHAYHSPLEKFLMQKRLAQTGTTNLNVANNSDGWNFLDKDTGMPDPQRLEDMRKGIIVHSQVIDRWMENAEDFNQSHDQDDAWARVFTAPQPDQPTLAQEADMAAFRQMLEPSSDTSFRSQTKSVALSIPDPNLNPRPEGYNPVGASYAPLKSNIGRPSGIDPLPAATSGIQTPSAPPSWAPQPPPWTRNTPQLFVNPVRKF